MAFPVPQTKLAIPRPPAHMVARQRLWQVLSDAATAQNRGLTLICAPAGYGKSTLVSTWLDQRPESPAAWLSLDEHDDYLDQFLACLQAAVTQVYPGLDLTAGISPQLQGDAVYRVFCASLINQLAQREEPLTLVLDDYHVLSNQLIHSAVTYLVDNLPRALHVIITSRADPPLPTAKWRARRQLKELRATDLRFTRDEIANFFSDLWGTSPSDGLLTMLETRTEGWITGLHLAALTIPQPPTAETALALDVSRRYIFDYLADEVFQLQTPASQRFLLETSILPRLSVQLCDATREQGGSAQFIQLLERTNLFITRLDDQGIWYRYHQLFADFLRRTLAQQTSQATISSLHQRASIWYEQQGARQEAIDHALQAQDWQRIVALLPTVTEVNELIAGSPGWRRVIEALPEALLAGSPRLLVCYGWVLTNSGEGARAFQLLPPPEAFDAAEDRDAAASCWVLRAYLSTLSGQHQQAIHFSQQALAVLPPGDSWPRRAVQFIQGYCHVNLGSLALGREILADLQPRLRPDDLVLRAYTAGALADAAYRSGDLNQAKRWSSEVVSLRYAQDSTLAPDPYVGLVFAYMMAGIVAYERNQQAEAERMFGEGLQAAALTGRQRYWPVLFAHLARVLALRGQRQQAESLFARAQEQAAQLNHPVHRLALLAHAIERALVAGDLALAAQQLEEAKLSLDQLPPADALEAYLAGVKLLAARHRVGQTAQAITPVADVLAQLRAQAQTAGAGDNWLKLTVLTALLRWQAGDVDPAVALLAEVLPLAERQGYARSFLDLGPPMAEVLAHPRVLKLAPAYVQELRQHIAGDSAAPALVPPLLSEREREILRLVAQGHSLQVITDKLVISFHTTRSHVKNIYAKLDAHSRLEAIERARALGLL